MAELLVDAEEPRRAGNSEQFCLSSWISTAPFEDLLDLAIVFVGNGRAELRMPFKVKHCQGGGLLHGGALTTLADTAVAMAVKSLLPEGTVFATISLQTEFVAPVREGEVRALAQVEETGERTYRGEAELLDAQGELVARFSSVFKRARERSSHGRSVE